MKHAALRRALVAALALAPLTACYRYTDVPVDQVASGQAVRARVTAVEADSLRASTGLDSRVVEGTVVATRPGGLMVRTVTGMVENGATRDRLYQRVELPTSSLLQVEVRQLDRGRTYGLIAAGVVGLGALVVSQFTGSEKVPTGGPKGGTDHAVVPLRLSSLLRFLPGGGP